MKTKIKQPLFSKKTLDIIINIPIYFKLLKRCNYLENEVDVLKTVIKDDLYKEFMKKYNEPLENQRLKENDKNLRLKIKQLKLQRDEAIAKSTEKVKK